MIKFSELRQTELDIIKLASERSQENDILKTTETVMDELLYDDHCAIDDIIHWVRQHKNGMSITKTPEKPHILQCVDVGKISQINDALKKSISDNSDFMKIGQCYIPMAVIQSHLPDWGNSVYGMSFIKYSDQSWECKILRGR